MSVEDFVRSTMNLDKLREKAHEIAKAAKASGASPTQLAKEARAKAAAQRAARATEDMTIAVAGEKYCKHCEDNHLHRGESTPRAIKRAVERADRFFGDTPLRTLGGKDGAAFLNWVVADVIAASEKRAKGEGMAAVGGRAAGQYPGHQAAATVKSHIRQVLKHAAAELGVDCRTDILDRWEPKQNPPMKSAMTPEQRAALFKAIDEWTQAHSNLTGARLATAKDSGDIIRFAFLTGSRQGEVRRMKWRQIENLDAPLDSDTPPTLIFMAGDRKQSSEHRLALDAESVAVLKNVRARRRRRGWSPKSNDYIFPSIKAKTPDEKPRHTVQAAFYTILEMAGLRGKDIVVEHTERLTPHRVVKASRITQIRDEFGWSPADVADELGMTVDVVEKVYYRDRTKVARSAARKKDMAPSLTTGNKGGQPGAKVRKTTATAAPP
jgi:integrase